MIKLAIVLPCYNEEEVLRESARRLAGLFGQMEADGRISPDSFMLFVNDGSRDATWDIIAALHAADKRVRGLNLARNVGHQAAIMAGMMTAKDWADAVITIDADLQDDLKAIPKMVDEFARGYDIVYGVKVQRTADPLLKRLSAVAFYKLQARMGVESVYNHADFRLMSRKMTDAVLSMAEYNRFSKGIFSWVGFKTKWIDYKNVERVAGTTKWNFWGLLKYSIEGIVGFSTAPLLMAAGLGLAFCVLAFVGIIIVVVRALMFGDPTSGWPSLVCIILLCSGVQLLCTGIAGEYLAKTYLETKHRPIYIAAETEEDLDAE